MIFVAEPKHLFYSVFRADYCNVPMYSPFLPNARFSWQPFNMKPTGRIFVVNKMKSQLWLAVCRCERGSLTCEVYYVRHIFKLVYCCNVYIAALIWLLMTSSSADSCCPEGWSPVVTYKVTSSLCRFTQTDKHMRCKGFMSYI